MAEEKAKAEGYEPLAFVRSWAVAAVDPGGQLLMGPGARHPDGPRAGRRLKLSDIDLVEMHEAFAAQVASNIQALESETWAREKLGRSTPVGKVDRDRLNVCGGSIAIGHPFGATGARITTTLANELKRRNGEVRPRSRCARRGAWASRWCSSDERRLERLHARRRTRTASSCSPSTCRARR